MTYEELPNLVSEMTATLVNAIQVAGVSLDKVNTCATDTHDLLEECFTVLEELIEPFDEVKEALREVEEVREMVSEKAEELFGTANELFDEADQAVEELTDQIDELKEWFQDELHRLIEESVKQPLIDVREDLYQDIDRIIDEFRERVMAELSDRFTTTLREEFSSLLDNVKAEFSNGMEELRNELFGTADSSESQRELTAQVREVFMNAAKPLLNSMDGFISLAGSVGVPVG